MIYKIYRIYDSQMENYVRTYSGKTMWIRKAWVRYRLNILNDNERYKVHIFSLLTSTDASQF